MNSKKSNRFSPEVRKRDVRMVQEHQGEYPSLWACMESIAPKISVCLKHSTTGLSRPPPRHVRGEADVQGLADRPFVLPAARCPPALSRNSLRHAERDPWLIDDIQRVWHANWQVYGANKLWKQMKREGIRVGRRTMERLTGKLRLAGARRGMRVRTTTPDTTAHVH